LLAPAHPATTIATAASAVAAWLQDDKRLKMIPLTPESPTDEPVDFQHYWQDMAPARQMGADPASWMPREMARGPACCAEPLIQRTSASL